MKRTSLSLRVIYVYVIYILFSSYYVYQFSAYNLNVEKDKGPIVHLREVLFIKTSASIGAWKCKFPPF